MSKTEIIEKLSEFLDRHDAEISMESRDRAEFINYIRSGTSLGMLRVTQVYKLIASVSPSYSFGDAMDIIAKELNK